MSKGSAKARVSQSYLNLQKELNMRSQDLSELLVYTFKKKNEQNVKVKLEMPRFFK